MGFPCGSAGKKLASKVGDLGLIAGLGRSPEEGKGYPLQYSGLENPMDYTVTKRQISNGLQHQMSFPVAPRRPCLPVSSHKTSCGCLLRASTPAGVPKARFRPSPNIPKFYSMCCFPRAPQFNSEMFYP